jgi:hypothetical protein
MSAAVRNLRAIHRGVLLYDGTPEPIRLVLDTATGRPILPLPTRAFDADEHVLHLPEESEHSLQLLVIPEEVPGAGEGPDRWRTYHGDAREARWSRFSIDCARLGRSVLDGAELMQPNQLIAHEPSLLRLAASDPARLAGAAGAAAGRPVEAPVPVGVDPLGLDVRARFGIVRLEFAEPVLPGSSAAAQAATQIDLLLRAAPGCGR